MGHSQRLLHSSQLTFTRQSTDRDSPLTISEMRQRQIAKIGEIADALSKVGLRTLDDQAKALGLLRSTTWNLLRANHKASGISTRTINRILAAPKLPPSVRAIILQYVADKTAGLDGDDRRRLLIFMAQLGLNVQEHARIYCTDGREGSMRRVNGSHPAAGKFHKGRASHNK